MDTDTQFKFGDKVTFWMLDHTCYEQLVVVGGVRFAAPMTHVFQNAYRCMKNTGEIIVVHPRLLNSGWA